MCACVRPARRLLPEIECSQLKPNYRLIMNQLALTSVAVFTGLAMLIPGLSLAAGYDNVAYGNYAPNTAAYGYGNPGYGNTYTYGGGTPGNGYTYGSGRPYNSNYHVGNSNPGYGNSYTYGVGTPGNGYGYGRPYNKTSYHRRGHSPYSYGYGHRGYHNNYRY